MTISKALDLDREGRNDAALDAIRRHQHGLLDHGGSLDETIEAFRRICDGEYDDLPEQAFFNIGGIEDLERRAAELKN